MGEEDVLGYSVSIDTKKNGLGLNIILKSGRAGSLLVESREEFSTIVDILRNERPVKFDPDTGILKTEWEPTGEEET